MAMAKECLKRIDERNYLTEREHKEFLETIEKDLDRLEGLEKIFSDSHICEIKARFKEIDCTAEKCDGCSLGIGDGICLKNTFEKKWELEKENRHLKECLKRRDEELTKVLDKACERLDYDCLVSQDLINDLDCENCNDDTKGCWRKYFLKEVTRDE